MRLTPQQKKIVEYLADGNWHCMATADFFIKDDRTRISELNRMGYEIEALRCDGRCGVEHSSGIVMRRIVKKPKQMQITMEERDGQMVAVETYV